MEENKNLTPETEEVEAVDTVEEAKPKKAKKPKKERKPRRLKNQAFLKRGSYSLALTAIVVAAVIVFNILIGALSNRFVLEFDMSVEKTNSVSEENVDYIKKVKDEVSVVVCADKESYTGGYMSYYAQQYGVTQDATEYYEQTVKLIEKYENYNSKIKVEFMDTQSSEFSAIASKYSADGLAYGDIIVSANKNGNERYKIVGFNDIYLLSEDSTYAAYGYTTSTVSGNNIETALTSAVAYVTSAKTQKVAFLTGHSADDYTEGYQKLLKDNNFAVDVIDDDFVSKISSDYDAVVIVAPTTDFLPDELSAIDQFLDNSGKLDKGLIFFANINAPYLTNLYDYLSEWGINVDEGILYETGDYHKDGDSTTLISGASGNDSEIPSSSLCFTSGNIPLTAEQANGGPTLTVLVETTETVAAAPLGTEEGWSAEGYAKQSYPTVLQSEKSDYDDDNNTISTRIFAFSSTDFIYSENSEYTDVYNKDAALLAAQRASHADNTGISFISKTITTESFGDKVTEGSANVVRVIFMFLLPVAVIVAGVYIYIKRRNAE